ncbi:arylsulfotransferase family protein [Haloprofundus salinisoli]|uniref:arylsulfotransferase family protein n=1 Tax=Haloprofundus salinisoli TaxID=2876193 RepID=UPI001CCEF9D9|nr:arylsulfotransferase family protein [Haloprofundus salinisoli]
MDMPSTRWILRALVAFAVLGLFVPAGIAAVTYDPEDETTLQRGTVTERANGSTVVSVQGFHFQGEGNKKKPARLVSVDERGETEWVYDGEERGATWFYDVDPLDNGNLFVVSTRPGKTLVYELNPETEERVWQEEFDIEDTHDATMLNDEEIAVANMRQWNDSAGRSDDRIFIYNRTTGEITWEWYFREHYEINTDGGMSDDWTHVNDIEAVGDEHLLLSPRNFDQAVLLNRTSGEIDLRLGEDDEHDVLNEQHNPDYMVSEDGNPVILVADSENHRVVEYEYVDGVSGSNASGDSSQAERSNGEWEQTWEVGNGQFTWPRDADRLPNGNTLITDTMNHRVVEVTPQGEIVWEYYATWGPYDAERVAHGGGSNGPTISDMGAEGSYDLSGSAGISPGEGDRVSFSNWIVGPFLDTPLEEPVSEFATTWGHLTPWIRPVWLSSWGFVYTVLGALLLVGWGAAELVVNRGRIRRRVAATRQRL